MPDGIDHLAGLADPVRRAAYRHVVRSQPAGADRNEVASALDISRSLAAYHLDRLVEDGLLVTRFEHRGVKPGPGSGRPSKIYERAPSEFAVSLPPRDYELAARVMASAIAELDEGGQRRLTSAAAAEGERLRQLSDESQDPKHAIGALLTGCGYEPYETDECIRLRNCPFDALAREHRDLVCSMNLALLDALLEPEVAHGCEVRLEPKEGECCVTIRGARL